MPEVRWSRGALSDLDAIGAYFEQTSPQYGRSVVARLYGVGAGLSEHPHLGRMVPEVGVDHIREIVRDGYRVVYLVTGGAVDVLAVLHGRQDLGRALRHDP